MRPKRRSSSPLLRNDTLPLGMIAARGRLGRYVLFDTIAAGGMGSVSFARPLDPAEGPRIVAVKRLHPHLAGDPHFARMFQDEARLATRIRHPNVVTTLAVSDERDE